MGDEHIPLLDIWNYRSFEKPFSHADFQHLIRCDDCLGLLAQCQTAKTMREVEEHLKDKSA
jgi:hypothetical protein